MATQAILDAAIQFCERSLAIYRSLDPFELEPGRSHYALETRSAQLQVARVKRAFVDGREISLVGHGDASPSTGFQGQPVRLHVEQNFYGSELVLTPTPDAPYTLRLEVATRPSRTAKNLDDDLADVWMDAIVAGALSIVQSIPAQPFSDPMGADKWAAEFRSQISRARTDGPINRVNSTLRVRARPFA